MPKLYCLCALLLLSQHCLGDVFGLLDPRTLSMGGTGVASAQSGSAALYNPALLATYDKRKELSDNSRFILPVMSIRITNVFDEIENFEDQDYEQRLSTAVGDFNGAPSPASALGVVDVAEDLRGSVNDIAEDSYLADAYAGIIIGLPGQYEGGSFYLFRRVYGRGNANVTDADRQILDDYIQGLRFYASGGAEGENRDIFDNGQLIDQSGNFTSEALVRGLDVIEAGVAASTEIQLLGRYYYVGMTPKFQIIRVYDIFDSGLDDAPEFERKTSRKLKMNIDVGMATDFGEFHRTGLVIRNLYPRDLETSVNNTIRIRPEVQAGYRFQRGQFSFATDLDVWVNDLFDVGDPIRNWSFGTEWKPFSSLALRGGYRHNLTVADRMGVVSIGMGLQIFRGLFDIAAAYGEDELGAALQFGYRF